MASKGSGPREVIAGLPGVSGNMGDNGTDYRMIDEGIQHYRSRKHR
jgi:hypothetical protein